VIELDIPRGRLQAPAWRRGARAAPHRQAWKAPRRAYTRGYGAISRRAVNAANEGLRLSRLLARRDAVCGGAGTLLAR